MLTIVRTALTASFVLVLTLGVAQAQEDDVIVIDPMEDEVFEEPEVMEGEEGCEFECGDEEFEESASYDGYFVINNNSSQEVCAMLIYKEEVDEPWEYYVGDDSGCLRSGNTIQVDYSISTESCDIYLEFVSGADEIMASGAINYCENESITIN